MRVPTATYRLQVHAGFSLADAAGIVEYLHDLGISDIYLSPVFEATPGSTHGYDVTDPTRVGRAIGGSAALDALAADVRLRGMSLLLDIVPNHMAASEHSPWWRDVLRHGRDSRYASFFDIDWGTETEPQRLLLPLLGGTLDQVLERDELRLQQASDGTWHVEYFGQQLPIATERCTEAELAACAAAEPTARRPLLRAVLERQHYQLDHWQVASRRLGYRRFFDITGLAGVRVEDAHVFEATHELILELLRSGAAAGLRIDHVDGLRDPTGYLEALRAHTDAYVVVEKILERDEPLPDWPVQGTTGYEVLNLINGLFVDPAGFDRLEQAYRRLTGEAEAFGDVVYRKKQLVMERLFAGERAALTDRLHAILGDAFQRDDVRDAVTELTAAMPVYRTYTRTPDLASADRRALETAFAELGRRAPELPAELVARVREVVFLEHEQSAAALEFVLRWQQFSGPVMAKGFEDTALYVYTPLISANEVGGSPAHAALAPAEFHARMAERARLWPHALSATATHDTKRGEDTRARIDVLSEDADGWTRRFRGWMRRSEEHKEEVAAAAGLDEDSPVPNAKEESLLYQTLIGAWPPARGEDDAFVERIKAYMQKAVREGKESTSWRRPDEDYETALAAFVDGLLEELRLPGVYREIEQYGEWVSWYGALNSLAQTLLKITCPGVPDFYQGTELWALTLVDPDNRTPVDYAERRARLAAMEPLLAAPAPGDVRSLLREWSTGDVKMYLTAAALRFRRAHAELYRDGAYLPLESAGQRAAHVVSYARTHPDGYALSVVQRLSVELCGPGELPDAAAWGDTRILLPESLRQHPLVDVLTGRTFEAGASLPAAELLASLPVALLGRR